VIGTARATWLQLRRPVLIIGIYLATGAMTWAVTLLNVAFADEPRSAETANGVGRTIAELELPAGPTAGLSVTVFGFGILLFCVSAATYGGHWTSGTLRTMLVRQPRRLHFVVGVWLALVVLAAGAVIVSAVVSMVVSFAVAEGSGVSTAAWSGGGVVRATLLAVAEAWVACVGHVTLGAALGLLMRTTVPAVALGFGWLFIVESLVPQEYPDSYRWLPGLLLAAIAADGTAAVPLGTALTTAALYVALLAVPAVVSFRRRDVLA
jgi:hypothetical protein